MANSIALTEVAEYIGVKSTFTAAYSPHQNGVNERNHAVCDGMISKMRMEDPSLSVNVALKWALVAKNSLENYSGFSPFQIVFGEAPKLPSVYTAGPPGLEEVNMNKSVADHINALHLAREAYTWGESNRVIKAALKQRIYKRGQDVKHGDWIYYKNNGKWQGPMKVCAKDGKSLYAVRAGKLLTINSDHADIAMFEDEFLGMKEINNTTNNKQDNLKTQQLGLQNIIPDDQNVESEQHTAETIENEKIENKDENQLLKIQKDDLIRYKKSVDSDYVDGKVISRAGKATGKYKAWWNIKNLNTGHIQAENLDDVSSIEKKSRIKMKKQRPL